MNWNPDQLRAIRADGNVIVSAAAGAGKTSVLTERVFRLVSEGTPIDRMLILTFTRAAAGEMKARISARLETAAREAERASERAFLRAQAQLCDSANISTMHAFCSKVVFRHFFRVGLAPSAKTMDETESAALQKTVRESVLTALASERPAVFRLLVGGFNGEQGLSDALIKLNRFLSAEPDPDAWLTRAEATLTDRPAFDALLEAEQKADQRALSLAIDELQNARDALPFEAVRAMGILDDILTHCRGALLCTDRAAYGAALSGVPTEGRLSFPKDTPASDADAAKKAKSALIAVLKEQTARYETDAKALFSTQNDGAKLILPLFDTLRTYRAAYAEEKRQRALLDFDDLEHMTIEILKDDGIAAEYRERFAYVIVDEYQDSNRVQEAILSRITRGNNLFFVGDVKQSIYRFRSAEPRLFLEKCRAFTGKDGTRVDLKQNFRSGEAVIGAVNRVFETILKEPIAAIAYDDAARLYRGSAETGGRVELHAIEKKAETDEESVENAEAEARLIAEHIAGRVGQPIYDPKEGMRPAAYRDFAILLRSKTHAAVFAETLALRGIPCYAQLSGGYFEAIEVQLMLNLLRVLDNRRQDIPLLAVLRSPFFGFTDDELIALRLPQKRGSLAECLLSQRETNAHLSRAFSKLDAWRRLARRCSIEELIETVFDETRFPERMGALPGGVQRVKNLDALLERARAFDASGAGGIHGFLAFMDAAAEASDLGASQTVTAEVVRIMTIHKSKGLEFPIVYLAALGSSFNRRDENDPLLLHETYGVGLQFLDETGAKRRTYARRLIRGAIGDASWQEELRVLYVGMTRARSELYLYGCVNNLEKTLDRLPLPSLLQVRAATSGMRLLLLALNGYLPIVRHTKAEVVLPDLSRALPVIPAPKPEELSALSARLAPVTPSAPAEALPAKTSVTALSDRTPIPFDEPDFTASDTGTRLGTRVHTVLERLPRDADAKTLEALTASVGGLPKSHLDALRWFIETPLFGRLRMAERAEREWSFVRAVPAGRLYGTDETEPILLQGVIDACFLENGAWVLLDYKTDRVEGDPAAHAERHRPQLTLYAESLEALTGLPVREAYVVLLNACAAVNLL